jgi:arylsulfatase A-like enzyme/Tfp pilus assembly protein PilF
MIRRRPNHGICVLLALLAAVAGVATAPAASTPAAPDSRPGLLLITLDTTRADHLGCYGDREAATPRLDRLAAEGAVAENAIATVPLTLPSHASILTSLYPPRHGVRDNGDFRLPERETTLAEFLKARGYRTAAVVASAVLSATQGLDQGFDIYDEPRAKAGWAAVGGAGVLYEPRVERSATEVTDAALAAIDRIGRGPFFLWVHYFDPHVEYVPPSPWRERFAARPYDGEIAYMDAEIGRLLDALDRRGRLSRAVVAVIGDHGEGLGGHGERTHGLLLYRETLRVPLIVRYPGSVRSGARLGGAVSGVDLAPTLLDLMGLPGMPGVQGKSFAAALRGGPEGDRGPVYSESLYGERSYGWAALYALTGRDRKFVEAPEPEIYDLAADPAESRNLAGADPAELDAWRNRLAAIRSSMGASDTTAAREATAEERARLGSLGYVSAGSPALGRKDRPDPKRLVALNDLFFEARILASQGRLEEARAPLEKVLASDPGNPLVLATSGTLLRSLGRHDEGIARLKAAARAAPGVHEIQRNLGAALRDDGKPREAAEAYRAAIAIRPSSSDSHFGLAKALHEQGDPTAAILEYRKAAALGFSGPAMHADLGLALADTGEFAEAEKELLLSDGADSAVRFEGWSRLGRAAARKGMLAEARRALDRALALQPSQPELLLDRAKVLRKLGDLPEAERSLERLLAASPGHPSARYLLAEMRASAGDSDGAARAAREFLSQEGADPRLLAPARDLLARMESR